jgi:uncharacterized membrane protein YccC
MSQTPQVGRRQLLRQAVALDRSQLAIARGVRNAIGVFIPLAVGILAGDIPLGVALAGGALLVGFVDLGASYATRARTMVIAAALVGFSTAIGTVGGGTDWLAVVLMAIWGIAAGLTVALGQASSFLGILAALGLMIAEFYSGSLADGLERGGLAIAGGLFQTALALAVWPLRPYRPERTAVAGAYRALGDFVEAVATGKGSQDWAPAVMDKIATAQVLLDDAEGSARSSTAEGEACRTLILEADRLVPEVVALAHVRGQLPERADAAVDDALDSTATALRAIAADVAGRHANPERIDFLRGRLRADMATIRFDGDDPSGLAARRLEAMRGQVRGAAEAALSWNGARAEAMVRRPVHRRRALGAHDAIAVLHANLTLDSPAFRHGLRLGIALAIGVALYRALDLPHGYWVPLTVVFVMRPDYGSTFSRGLQRYAGTVIGAVVATALTVLLDPGDWTLAILVAIFAAILYATLFAQYAIFTAAITAMIVFFVAFDGVREWAAVTDRLLDTAIGGALSLIAYVVFPTWEGDRVQSRIAELIDADRRYCSAVLEGWVDPSRCDPDAVRDARRAGRRARTAAELSVEQARAEPERHRGDISADRGLLASARRLADGALALEAALEDERVRQPRPALAPLAHDVDAALSGLVSAEREGGTPGPLPVLRGEFDALAKAEPPGSLVVQETDRMVNAIGTIEHLLGAGSR